MVSFTLDAVTEPELQLPVPVSVLLSPTAGFAPAGLNVVDEFVKMWMYPHPVPACTVNSVLLMMPTIGPTMVAVEPLCVYDCVPVCGKTFALGEVTLCPAHAAKTAHAPRAAHTAVRFMSAS